jgi:flavin-dependent dehydrogenase
MTNLKYDLIIVGGGPIGSVISYFSTLNKKDLNLENIALIQLEPKTYDGIAYPYAGGSIRWYFEDKDIENNTKKTADFILNLKNKIDLNLVEDNYFFTHKGIFLPSLNISGKKLVDYLKKEGELNGLKIYNETEFQKIEQENDYYKIITNKEEFYAKKVIFSLGYKNKEYFNIPLEIEKRQLFVLDLEINEKNKNLPHTIIKFKNGIIYYFIKKFDDGYKLVLGQEDVFEQNDNLEPENYFKELLNMGLEEQLPFLKNTNVLKILWGFDVKNKKPIFNKIYQNVYAVNCGSAIRSLIGIGEESLKILKQ